jgi:hypothetical protein
MGFICCIIKVRSTRLTANHSCKKVNVNATERLGSIVNAMFPPEQPRSRVQTEEEKLEKCEEILKEPVGKSICFIM